MFEFAQAQLPRLLGAVSTTIELWLLAVALGTVLGVALGIGRVYGSRPLSTLITVYVDVVRGTPMLVQMFILYFGLPDVGVTLNPFAAAVLAIGLNSAAYQAEYVRAAVLSLSPNQFEAALAIGLSRSSAIVNVIIPQSFRLILPAWSNEAVVELQYTSVAYTIGVIELTGRAEKVGYETYEFFKAFMLCGSIYVLLTAIIVVAIRYLRLSFAIPTR